VPASLDKAMYRCVDVSHGFDVYMSGDPCSKPSFL
jgi:hypothetical protein